MKVSIRGDNVTPENIAAALAACERDHGLKIKGATVYVRFEDNLGRTVEPLQDGHEITREFTFRKPRPVEMPTVPEPQIPPEPVDPISAKEMLEICQRAAQRVLSAPEMTSLILMEKEKVERHVFQGALRKTMDNSGRFNIHTLVRNVAAKNMK